jgi:hypothetical protein
LVQENDIHVDLPGLNTFLSFSETDTEKSEFCSGSPILSSGSFSDLIKAVLSTKSSNLLYKSGNNKALLDKKSLTTNPEDKIGEPSPIRGNKFSQLSLENFKETGDESFAWESFEKKLSAYSFLKYLVQENDIHVDLHFNFIKWS